MRAILGGLVAAALALSGCISEGDFRPEDELLPILRGPLPVDERLPRAPDAPRVVVAVIDSGTNPYHDWFQRDASLSDDVLGQFLNADGTAPARVPLSREGNFTQRLEADNDTWGELKPGVLYYFEGTNLLGISFDDPPEDGYLFLTGASHGTATSGAVVQNNPNAVVVMVQGDYGLGEAWVAATPWIDVFSMSYGPPGSVPGSGPALGLNTHVHTKKAWAAGKVPVGAADNSPSLAINDETAGPPWVVGVAGDNSTTHCREHVSGTFPDFTSDFTQRLPRFNDHQNATNVSGTSFATPKTAGVFSAVLFQVRSHWGHVGGIVDGALALGPDGERLTNAGLRDAFNRTARYFESSACSPSPGTRLPVNPAAPYAQMGWGHVGPEIAQGTFEHLVGIEAAPQKPGEARQFQETMYHYREALWNRI